MESNDSRHDAAAALDLVTSTRSAIADRLITPPWYHPALGLITGGFIAAQSAGNAFVTLGVVAVFGACLGALATWYRKKTGMMVNGLRAGRATRWAIASGLITVALYVAGLYLYYVADWWAGPLVCGVLAVPVVTVLGLQFDRAMRAELREGK